MAADADVPLSPDSVEEDAAAPAPRRKTFPRKGHTKSRKGCFNCKRRKIKCQETRPSCSNCVKADLECQYPEVTSRWASVAAGTSGPIVQPQATPTVFTMEDMKLFHHFIQRAYPHLPVGADSLWKAEIPGLAHQHDFLIHSMLALAASHLSMNGLGDYRNAALQHRVIAVRLLNESLSRVSATQTEADAKLASCLALTFQSSYMEDGFLEFLTMIRGCTLVTQDHSLEHPTSAFHCFSGENHGRTMQHRLREIVPANEIDPSVLDSAAASLEALKPLCTTAKENEYRQILYDIVQQTYHSPLQAYFTFCESYNWPSHLAHAEFAAFINPSNQTGQLLLSHFVALQVLQQCTTEFVWSDRDTAPPSSVPIAWLRRLNDWLKPEFREYNAWPMQLGAAFEAFVTNAEERTASCLIKSKPLDAFSAKNIVGFEINDVSQLFGVDPDLGRSFPM